MQVSLRDTALRPTKTVGCSPRLPSFVPLGRHISQSLRVSGFVIQLGGASDLDILQKTFDRMK